VIAQMTNLPTGVIGFETGGTIRAEDYRDVVLPALGGRRPRARCAS
jgi:hypothetical protein